MGVLRVWKLGESSCLQDTRRALLICSGRVTAPQATCPIMSMQALLMLESVAPACGCCVFGLIDVRSPYVLASLALNCLGSVSLESPALCVGCFRGRCRQAKMQGNAEAPAWPPHVSENPFLAVGIENVIVISGNLDSGVGALYCPGSTPPGSQGRAPGKHHIVVYSAIFLCSGPEGIAVAPRNTAAWRVLAEGKFDHP